ncbi:RNA polymerase sigma factor SigJ [Sporosarcina sp. NCCP-2222]|uniref:RNA polymerase sigma factor SigJ n=1 Tax=Sporosarcina sp. NCCP-2222 TaxID=2935073 RepID=UPI0020830F58|nr:RNA polymerase sigma factor SigJ [Sporosarcina sp. NCCP-2222]GKV55210.1 RNA polymerase sigma factor SigJ [Sporosarcina sp. NCCP-2222]
MEQEKIEEYYVQYKRLLFTLAYQLTGSAADAEDVVHDVFMKLHDIELDRIVEPKAYLCKMATNRCLDVLKTARRKREQYVGQWLPEPILTFGNELVESVIQKELISYAMLVLLEKLTPVERAAFVLYEALSFKYSVIAKIIGKSETNCRKLVSRARGKIGMSTEAPLREADIEGKWIEGFLTALEQGDLNRVISILAEDVTLISDGGGKAFAAIHPIHSSNHVARFLLGIAKNMTPGDSAVDITKINGQTGLVYRTGNKVDTVALLHIHQGAVRNLYFIRNPEKLRYI